MAAIRVSPGVYRDPRTGRTVQAVDQVSANRLLAQQAQAKKDRRSDKRGATQGAGVAGGGGTAAGGGTGLDPGVKEDVGASLANQGSSAANNNLSEGMQLEDRALDAAGRYLEDYDQFDPTDIKQTGGFEDYGNRVNDAVFAKLTRNMDRDKAREREQLQQELYNRGIPLDANDKQYSAQMGALDERYDAQKEAAMNNALIYGGQEASRYFNMADTTRKTNLGEFNALKDPTYTNMTAAEKLAYDQLNEQRRSSKAAEDIARQNARRSGGGAPPPEPQSPFIT